MEKQFTATTYLFFKQKTLLLKHPKLEKWLPPGGHIEKNETPPCAAKREVKEETGLEFNFIRDEHIWINEWNANSIERPYMCLKEEIPKHKNVEAHQHIDFIFIGKVLNINSFNPLFTSKWFSQFEVDLLDEQIEIYRETKMVLNKIFNSNFAL